MVVDGRLGLNNCIGKTLKHFCGKWQNLAQTLKLDVEGIELRTPNVQDDKKISRGGWGMGGGIRIK